jgi:signal peptidase I
LFLGPRLTAPAVQAKAAAMENSEKIEVPPVPKAKETGGAGEFVRFVLTVFLIAVVIRSFIVAPFNIPSGSMLPKMMIGDYLFAAKWPYGYSRFSMPFGLGRFEGRIFGREPDRGDVVVFRYPGGGEDDYVKRLIGLPGDQIRVKDGILYLNGDAVPRVRIADYLMPMTPNSPCRTVDPEASRIVTDEEGQRYCAFPRYRETLPGGRSYEVLDQVDGIGDNTPVFIVPDGHYFVMGDNRDDSQDSRFSPAVQGVGFLPRDNLIGEALINFWSTDGSAEWSKPWTWLSATRWERIGDTF